jgi:two-component system, cell cycle response regulator DivK
MTEKCVLVADDNADNRAVYVMMLEHLGYRVIEADDGESACAAAAAARPDLILMDLQMPGVNGFQATQQLKEDPATADIPIVAVTAMAMREDRQMALAAGCDDYYAKPLEPRVMAKVVEKWLGQPSAGAQNP